MRTFPYKGETWTVVVTVDTPVMATGPGGDLPRAGQAVAEFLPRKQDWLSGARRFAELQSQH